MPETVYYDIAPGVHLACIRDLRFKTGSIDMELCTPLEKPRAAMNAVLPYVLLRGSAVYPDMVSLRGAFDDLAGARVEPVIRKKGESHFIGLYADFPDEGCVSRDQRIPEKVCDLMGQILLAPATSGGRLRRDYVDTERENLIADIRAEINDKRSYAESRLREIMFDREAYAVPRIGREIEAKRISVATLTKYYKELMATAPVYVTYCGSADPQRMERAVRSALAAIPRRTLVTPPPTAARAEIGGKTVRFRSETMDLAQARLCMGYRLGETKNEAALLVMNAMLGASPNSRLFRTLREEDGMSYYVSSFADKYKGALFISAGLGSENMDKAVKTVEEAVSDLARGSFTDEELRSAKVFTMNSIYTAMDSQSGIVALQLDSDFSGGAPGDLLAGLAELVRPDDVMECAERARLDTVYFLSEGEEDHAE